SRGYPAKFRVAPLGTLRGTRVSGSELGTQNTVMRVRVRVPATTANLGPGFDALGMTLAIHNTLTIEAAERPAFVSRGAGSEKLTGRTNTVIHRAVAAA